MQDDNKFGFNQERENGGVRPPEKMGPADFSKVGYSRPSYESPSYDNTDYTPPEEAKSGPAEPCYLRHDQGEQDSAAEPEAAVEPEAAAEPEAVVEPENKSEEEQTYQQMFADKGQSSEESSPPPSGEQAPVSPQASAGQVPLRMQTSGGQTPPPPPPSYTYGWSYDEYEKARNAAQPEQQRSQNRGLKVFICIIVSVFVLSILALAVVGVSHLVMENNMQTQLDQNTPGDNDNQGNQAIDPDKPTLPITPSDPASGEDDEADGELTRKQIAAKVKPSVVGVLCQVTTSEGQSGQSYGSGIVMTEDGYIITNAHVIENATSITVIMDDEEKGQYKATLVGKDTTTDLAVLKIDATGLTAAEFGDSSLLEVGDIAVAVGNPYRMELAGSVTFGYISAINRNVTLETGSMTLLQTDASINPGNSGGPLCNAYGQVIGINTVKIGSGYEGLGFAIPINDAKTVIDMLLQYGVIAGRPMIGISGAAVTQEMTLYYRWPQGIYVQYVNEDTDAYAKGIQSGDIITKVDGTDITSMADLNDIKNQKKAGDSLALTIYRNGETYEVSVVLYDEASAGSN